MIDTSFKTESPGTMQQVHTKFMLFLSIYRVAPKKLHIHQHSIPLELFKINTHTHPFNGSFVLDYPGEMVPER